jgi:aryl-alcohol dehydrogenase-like predicted oxidoreductase
MTMPALPPPRSLSAPPRAVCLGVALGSRARTMASGELAALLGGALDAGASLLLADAAHERPWRTPIGTLLGKRRDEAVLAGCVGRRGARLSPAAECRRMLRRMGVEHLDLCLLDARSGDLPIEERVGELGELVRAGLVAGIGLYGGEAGELDRAHAEHPLTVTAFDYSLADRRAEAGFLPTARRLGLPVLACRPLAGGALTGRAALTDSVAAIRLRAAQRIAAHEDIGAARLALAWLAARPAELVPVVGCTDPIHLEYDLAALRTRLRPETLAALEAVFPSPVAAGSGP